MPLHVFLVSLIVAALGALPVASASAGAPGATYDYLIGVPGFPANIAQAANSDTVEVSGTGTLSVHTKSVSGSGTFTHRNAAGAVIGSGTWTATELLSFQDYGQVADPAAFGLPPGSTSGRAMIRVRLTAGTLQFDGIMEVTCHLPGVKAPHGHHEGIRLNIPGALNFNKQVSGATLFIRQP